MVAPYGVVPPVPGSDPSVTLTLGSGYSDRPREGLGSQVYMESSFAATVTTFTSTCRPDDVLLAWQDVTHRNTKGFTIYRSTDPAQLREQLITDLIIPTHVEGEKVAYYEYADSTVQAGTLYYYTLEDIARNGTTALHEPVSAAYPCEPTAVTLNEIEIYSNDNNGVAWLSIGLLAGVAALGVARRRK